jgi:hypothetical protein
MVIQNAINNVKEKPHEEKKAVATSIAVGVVIVLLVGWGFLFLRKIQRGSTPTLEGSAVPQDQIDSAFIQQTQQQINQFYQSSQDQLREIRETSAQNEANTGYTSESVDAAGSADAFGNQ